MEGNQAEPLRVAPESELRSLLGSLDRRSFLSGAGKLMAGGLLAGGFGSLLEACAGGSTPSSSNGGGSGGSGSGGQLGTVTYMAPDVPVGWDWDGPDGAVPQTQFGMDQVFGRLVRYKVTRNSSGVLMPDFSQLEGELAESWTQNGLTWTFKLRQGVKSPAGNEFTADDVLYLVARAKSVSGAAPIGWFLLNVGSVIQDTAKGAKTIAETNLGNSFKKIDKYTVEFTQFAPNQLFPGVLSIFGLAMADSTEMQKHATASDPWSHDWLENSGAYTAGFGPYKLESWTQGSQATFVPNPGWTDPALVVPAVQKVVMTAVPETSVRVGAIESGGAQMTTNLTSREWSSLKGNSNVKLVSFYGNQNMFMFLNNAIKPFDNVTLRQAIAYAIPYDEIIKSAYYGFAKPWYGCVPSSSVDFHEVKTFSTDYEKAASLLKQAGYPGGKGLEQYASAMSLYYAVERSDQLAPVANLTQSSLAKVGINITLSPIPTSEYGKRQLVQKNLPFAIDDQEKPIAPDAGYAIQLFFVTSSKGGLNNMENYSNSTVDDLWLNKARSEANPSKRAAYLATAQEIIMKEVAWIPVLERETLVALAPDLTDYEWNPDNSPRMYYLRKA